MSKRHFRALLAVFGLLFTLICTCGTTASPPFLTLPPFDIPQKAVWNGLIKEREPVTQRETKKAKVQISKPKLFKPKMAKKKESTLLKKGRSFSKKFSPTKKPKIKYSKKSGSLIKKRDSLLKRTVPLSRKKRVYHRPVYIAKDIWNAMAPYFLPLDHPLKVRLDEMFSKKRVTANCEALTAAGFYGRKGNRAGAFSHCTVVFHENFSGYVLKLFTDDSPHEDWPQLKRRIEGARSLQAAITRHGWEGWFKVPRKWIYPLPPSPAPETFENIPIKGFILIAEDMMVFKKYHNDWRWHEFMTKEKLDALYTLLREEGLSDSVFPFNMPFTQDNKIAFIDLEKNHMWPIPYHKLTGYLHEKLQAYWVEITSQPPPEERAYQELTDKAA